MEKKAGGIDRMDPRIIALLAAAWGNIAVASDDPGRAKAAEDRVERVLSYLREKSEKGDKVAKAALVVAKAGTLRLRSDDEALEIAEEALRALNEGKDVISILNNKESIVLFNLDFLKEYTRWYKRLIEARKSLEGFKNLNENKTTP